MNFQLIDVSKWKRKAYFDHFLTDVPCTYSITVNLNITSLLKVIKPKNIKLYPCMIHLISSVVNRHEEFRMAINEKGELGVFDEMSPSYAIFVKEYETFTNIWTEYKSSFSEFYGNYLTDVEKYGESKQFIAKPNPPMNLFTISGIPWVSFTGFNLNLPTAFKYLIPIFTTGKFFTENDKILLPISIQVHHAVCDGFHVSRFINELQDRINQFEDKI